MLDFNHVCAHIGEVLRGEWPREDARHINDEVGQCRHFLISFKVGGVAKRYNRMSDNPKQGFSANMSDENPITQTTPFEQIGGATRIQELVTRFYDLMEIEPKYADLRATHHENLAHNARKIIRLFKWLFGGPQLYIEKYGHPRLKARHMPFKIGVTERDQWVACMAQAMREIGVEESLFQNSSFRFTAPLNGCAITRMRWRAKRVCRTKWALKLQACPTPPHSNFRKSHKNTG